MSKLEEKIIYYINTKWALKLRKETWIWMWNIYSFKNKIDKTYTKQTLDILYDFFWLEKDSFYFSKLKREVWYKNSLWLLFKLKREELKLTKKDVAKQIKWSERHLSRIESWDSDYKLNSYYIKTLISLYNFSEVEKEYIKNYISSLKQIINLCKLKCHWIEDK